MKSFLEEKLPKKLKKNTQIYNLDVSHPAQFEKIYSAKGIDIFKMVPKSAHFKCIGHVARKTGESPVAEEYCCVREKYLVPAKAEWAWNNKGLTMEKATVWSVIRDDFMEEARKSTSYDIFSGSFILQS